MFTLLKKDMKSLRLSDGLETKQKLEIYDPCINILDRMLPKISGEKVCRWIREDMKSMMPVIMLTAKVEVKSRIKGFKLGADNYVVKPFSAAKLKVRVEAVLRRTESRCGKLRFTGFMIKPAKGEAWIHKSQLELTHYELKLQHLFM
ncbi:response regulator transcription factor [Rossellomorea vietnamensis]|uniref:Response regulator transcription factor n=1 Tax=Rossellomorea vietnamensis TaxID=218284 RepID=A0A5D4K911_9BACI|nr:response regulator transcription factor [Rossellomorea vietnamensis]